jgi:hypothetical protein
MVEEHYPRLGFTPLPPTPDSEERLGSWWRLDISDYVTPTLPVEMVEVSRTTLPEGEYAES